MWKLLVLLALAAEPQFGLSQGGLPPSPPPPPAQPVRPGPPPAERCTARRPPDVSCASDAECTVVRTVSCCGTVGFVAVNRLDAARYESVERRCSPGRRCGCAPGPTRLDDGSTWQRGDGVAVACEARRCVTRLAPRPEPELPEPADTPCTPTECGPAPLYPTGVCPDGVSRFGRGPCVRQAGRCGWQHLSCP